MLLSVFIAGTEAGQLRKTIITQSASRETSFSTGTAMETGAAAGGAGVEHKAGIKMNSSSAGGGASSFAGGRAAAQRTFSAPAETSPGADCAAITCSGEYPQKDTDNRCYKVGGGTCRQHCLTANNCLQPSYSGRECVCVYPVDFSPIHTEACIGGTQKVYQPGMRPCTPSGGGAVPQTPAGACEAPEGFACNIAPLTVGYGGNWGEAGRPFDVNRHTGSNVRSFALKYGIVNVHPVKYEPAVYTGSGAYLESVSISGPGSSRHTIISSKPGSSTPAGSGICGRYADETMLYIVFDDKPYPAMPVCRLKKNTQYYLNVSYGNSDLPDPRGVTFHYVLMKADPHNW